MSRLKNCPVCRFEYLGQLDKCPSCGADINQGTILDRLNELRHNFGFVTHIVKILASSTYNESLAEEITMEDLGELEKLHKMYQRGDMSAYDMLVMRVNSGSCLDIENCRYADSSPHNTPDEKPENWCWSCWWTYLIGCYRKEIREKDKHIDHLKSNLKAADTAAKEWREKAEKQPVIEDGCKVPQDVFEMRCLITSLEGVVKEILRFYRPMLVEGAVDDPTQAETIRGILGGKIKFGEHPDTLSKKNLHDVLMQISRACGQSEEYQYPLQVYRDVQNALFLLERYGCYHQKDIRKSCQKPMPVLMALREVKVSEKWMPTVTRELRPPMCPVCDLPMTMIPNDRDNRVQCEQCGMTSRLCPLCGYALQRFDSVGKISLRCQCGYAADEEK